MLTALVVGLTISLSELFRWRWLDWSPALFWAFVALNWLVWGVLLWIYTYRVNRFQALSRMTGTLIAGSMAELLASIPAHILAVRRSGCFAGIGTGRVRRCAQTARIPRAGEVPQAGASSPRRGATVRHRHAQGLFAPAAAFGTGRVRRRDPGWPSRRSPLAGEPPGWSRRNAMKMRGDEEGGTNPLRFSSLL
jgi:hypothetical protein